MPSTVGDLQRASTDSEKRATIERQLMISISRLPEPLQVEITKGAYAEPLDANVVNEYLNISDINE
jgi:hypothetical protein